jgi:hypothetical protein
LISVYREPSLEAESSRVEEEGVEVAGVEAALDLTGLEVMVQIPHGLAETPVDLLR